MSIFLIAAIVGFALPLICLPIVWKNRSSKLYTLVFLGLQAVQILTEKFLASQDLRHIIKYTAIAFVIIRLLQLGVGFKGFKQFLPQLTPLPKVMIAGTYLGNWVLWVVILVRLTMRIAGLR